MILSHILLHSLVRAIDLVGMFLLVGGLVFRSLVVRTPPTRPERLLLFLLLIVGLFDLVLRSQMISGRPLEEIRAYLPIVLLKTHFGTVWIVRTFLLCLLGTVPIIIPERVRKKFAPIVGGLLLLTESLSGHAADSGDFSLAVLADWLHLLAVSAWAGGLFFLAFVLRKWMVLPELESTSSDIVVAVKRFSTLAGFCVLLILATGSYQVWHRVGSLAGLFQTPYGQTFIVKLLLVLPLLGLGALNRYRVLPELSRHAINPSAAWVRQSLKRLVKTVTIEIGLALAVIVCVALLLQLPPARGQLSSAYKASSHPKAHLQKGEAQK